MRRSLLIALLVLATPLAAQRLEPLPEPPPIPEGAEIEGIEPEVTIRYRGEDRVREYRLHGRLYMVEITPAHGVPYYLVDLDGDGEMVRHDRRPDLSVPMWVLHSW